MNGYVLIVISPYGYTAYEKSEVTDTGRTSRKLEGHNASLRTAFDSLVDGGILLDNRPVPAAQYKHQIVNGPMVNVDLAPDEVDEPPVVSPMMLIGLQGVFSDFAQASNDGWGGLRRVSKEQFSRDWVAAGARAGKKMGEMLIVGVDVHKIDDWLAEAPALEMEN